MLLTAALVVFSLELTSTLKGPKTYSGADMVNTVVPQSIRVPKFLILFKDNEEAAEFALVALLGCDVDLAGGSFATQSSASIVDWTKSGARSLKGAQAVASTAN